MAVINHELQLNNTFHSYHLYRKLEVELAMPCKRETTIFSMKIDDNIATVTEGALSCVIIKIVKSSSKRLNVEYFLQLIKIHSACCSYKFC